MTPTSPGSGRCAAATASALTGSPPSLTLSCSGKPRRCPAPDPASPSSLPGYPRTAPRAPTTAPPAARPPITPPRRWHDHCRDSRPGSRTHAGLGTWGDRRRHRGHLLGRLPRLGTPARHVRPLLAPDPAARPHRRHRPHDRRDRPGLRHRRRARGSAPRRLRQPPRGRLPGLLSRLQTGRPATRPRGSRRRQGHPRHDHRPPVRVRDPHRPLVRAGPRAADARQDHPALPPPS